MNKYHKAQHYPFKTLPQPVTKERLEKAMQQTERYARMLRKVGKVTGAETVR